MLSIRFSRPLAGMAIVAAGLAVSLAGAQTTQDSRSKTARNRMVAAADVSGAAANPSATRRQDQAVADIMTRSSAFRSAYPSSGSSGSMSMGSTGPSSSSGIC